MVYLVGAGPGDPGLLTLRAVEVLRLADLVLYDRLVPVAMLEHASPGAERICVTELAPHHPERCPHIHRVMIEAALQGKTVVRLKGGDPSLFGRVGEEAAALREAGIAFEIVPGVTAGLAAASCAGLPLTHRDHASAVAFITGHECPGKDDSRLDWPALARFPGTLVFYMGIGRLQELVDELVRNGKAAETPAAVVQWAGTNRQRTVEAPLGELPAAVARAGLGPPAVVVIGPIVALRSRLAWFEQRPLFGRTVLVTRPRQQVGDFVRRLELRGAIPYVLPVVEVHEPADWGPVDAALDRLADYQWLVFTSANGVHFTLRRLRERGRDLRALGGIRLAAIGPATAEALRQYHLEPDLVPPAYRSESLAAALKERVAGQRVLLARADRGRELLREELSAVARVEQIAVYSQVDAVDAGSAVLRSLNEGEIEFVALTSANIARALLGAMAESGRERIRQGAIRLVTISDVSSAAVRELGFPVAGEATVHTTAGVLDVLEGLAACGFTP